jgi:hypothetical protein
MSAISGQREVISNGSEEEGGEEVDQEVLEEEVDLTSGRCGRTP